MTDRDDSAPPPPPAEPVHEPILVDEVLRLLAVRDGGQYIDATANGGGHTRAILDTSAPNGRVLALDRDEELIDRLRDTLAGFIDAGRLVAVHASFSELREVSEREGFRGPDGILFDLGLSSYHLDHSGRGFAFARDEPLDMRFGASEIETGRASDLIAHASADELTAIFRTFGEERFASRIARTIVSQRRQQDIRSTAELFNVVERSLPAHTRWRAARHAARIFQALRIAVNDEIETFRSTLPDAWELLAPKGRLVVLAFHSLEDRIVKRYFRDRGQHGDGTVLTKKPLSADESEVARNSRAASAKLRAIEKA